MTFDFDFPRVSSHPLIKAKIKTQNSDFFVAERLQQNFSGEGEHLWIYIEKDDQNTEFVARQLARYFGVKPMDVGYSGLKDRRAVTRQWFSIYVRNRQYEDLHDLSIEGVKVIQIERHNKKLRRGEHSGNDFVLSLRELSEHDGLEQALSTLRQYGFPNYFGTQRFGRNGENVSRALAWFEGKIKASRSQRSFYLSAVRSYLFNHLLARKIKDGSWDESPSGGPLYGDPVDGVAPMTGEEQEYFDNYPELVSGLHRNRMTLARRPYKMIAQNLEWSLKDNVLELRFGLDTGAFATSLLHELFEIEDASSRIPENSNTEIK